MKILLLGATGRTGKLVLESAVKKGFKVNCLVRNLEKVAPADSVSVFEGDVRNEEHLRNAMADCKYVISVLNISRHSDFPWSPLRTPETLLSGTMKQLIEIGKEKNIEKIVICSAWGVAETNKDLPFWFRWLIAHSNIGKAYKDHEEQEEILKNSDLNYTIVRPTALINSMKKQFIKESFNNHPKPALMVSRKAVANYLTDSLKNESLNKKTVVISKK